MSLLLEAGSQDVIEATLECVMILLPQSPQDFEITDMHLQLRLQTSKVRGSNESRPSPQR